MKAGDILIASGITVGSLVSAGSSIATEKQKPGTQQTLVCTEEEQEAFHQYLLEQGLQDMAGILGDACSEFNSLKGIILKTEPGNPEPEGLEK